MSNNKRILVFSATYNEIENIRELISGIKKNLTNASILIIDDNSPDKTQEVIKELKKDNDVILLKIEHIRENLKELQHELEVERAVIECGLKKDRDVVLYNYDKDTWRQNCERLEALGFEYLAMNGWYKIVRYKRDF